MLYRLSDSIARLHVRHQMSGVIQCALDHKHVLALPHGSCLIAQHYMVDLRESVRFGQVGAAGRQPGTIVVIVAAKALLQAAHVLFGLTM